MTSKQFDSITFKKGMSVKIDTGQIYPVTGVDFSDRSIHVKFLIPSTKTRRSKWYFYYDIDCFIF